LLPFSNLVVAERDGMSSEVQRLHIVLFTDGDRRRTDFREVERSDERRNRDVGRVLTTAVDDDDNICFCSCSCCGGCCSSGVSDCGCACVCKCLSEVMTSFVLTVVAGTADGAEAGNCGAARTVAAWWMYERRAKMAFCGGGGCWAEADAAAAAAFTMVCFVFLFASFVGCGAVPCFSLPGSRAVRA